MRPVKTVTSTIGVMTLFAGMIAAQEFQIRARVDLVVVSFAVKDDNDGFVTDLDQDDFTVLEDGEVQEIQQFSLDPVPLSAVVLIDTGLPVKGLTSVQESIPAIVAAFSKLDEVAVYKFDNSVHIVQDFESDPVRVRLALDQLRDLAPTIATVGGQAAQPSPSVNGSSVIVTAKTPLNRDKRVLHDAVYAASLALRNRPEDRRKMILLISDGNARESKSNFNENLMQLMDNEIQVYTVGVKVKWFSRIKSVLNDYATWTGGAYSSAGSYESLERSYSKLTEQARNQYVLGYVSNNQAPPTKIVFRRIEILCEKPYKINHKRGYYQIP